MVKALAIHDFRGGFSDDINQEITSIPTRKRDSVGLRVLKQTFRKGNFSIKAKVISGFIEGSSIYRRFSKLFRKIQLIIRKIFSNKKPGNKTDVPTAIPSGKMAQSDFSINIENHVISEENSDPESLKFTETSEFSKKGESIVGIADILMVGPVNSETVVKAEPFSASLIDRLLQSESAAETLIFNLDRCPTLKEEQILGLVDKLIAKEYGYITLELALDKLLNWGGLFSIKLACKLLKSKDAVVVLKDNFKKFLVFGEEYTIQLSGNLLESKLGLRIFEDNLKSFTCVEAKYMIRLIDSLLKSESGARILANNLSDFPDLKEEDCLRLVDKLLESELGSETFTSNLDKFTSGHISLLASKLLESESGARILANNLSDFPDLKEEDCLRLVGNLLESELGSEILEYNLDEFTSRHISLLASKLLESESGARILANNLSDFPDLKAEHMLQLVGNLLELELELELESELESEYSPETFTANLDRFLVFGEAFNFCLADKLLESEFGARILLNNLASFPDLGEKRSIQLFESRLTNRDALALKIETTDNPPFLIGNKKYCTDLYSFLAQRRGSTIPVDNYTKNISETTLQDIVKSVFKSSSLEKAAFKFIERLDSSRDAVNNNMFIQGMRNKIKVIIYYIDSIEDEELKLQVMGKFADGGSACSDRAVTVLEELYLEAKLGTSVDIKSIIGFFIDKFKLDILKEIVYMSARGAENVETFLYYLIELKDLLGLNISSNKMLHSGIANPAVLAEVLTSFLSRTTAETLFNLLMENSQIKNKLMEQLGLENNTKGSELSIFMGRCEDIIYNSTDRVKPVEEVEDIMTTSIERFKEGYLLSQLIEMKLFFRVE